MGFALSSSPRASFISRCPWESGEVEVYVTHLRELRGSFLASESSESFDQETCNLIIKRLGSLLTSLLKPDPRAFLDSSEGRDHLALSVLIQCIVNCLSHMAQRRMQVSGEVTATLIVALVYEASTREWVFSTGSEVALPIWRCRIGCYAFVLTTSLITSAQQSGIPPDFAVFLDLATRCMRTICTRRVADANLAQTWFDHCIQLTSAMCASPPKEPYWIMQEVKELKAVRLGRAVDLCSALGTMLLLHEYEARNTALEMPSMKRMAELSTEACLPVIKTSCDLWLEVMLKVLRYCVNVVPFRLDYEEVCEGTLESIPVDGESLNMLSVLRGAVYLTLNLLPPIEDRDGKPQDEDGVGKIALFPGIIRVVGDLMVIVDSLLQAHLSTCDPIGPRRKAPSLMDSMGTFNFNQPRSICFAYELKQELIRCLLMIIHSQPQLVPCVASHPRVKEITCSLDGNALVPLNAPDVFWALVNSSQRDPASPLAVEWTIILLDLLLKPTARSPRVLQASTDLAALWSARWRLLFRHLCTVRGVKPLVSQILDASGLNTLLAKPAESRNLIQVLQLKPNFDDMIVKPLVEVSKLHPTSVLDLLKVALSEDLETIYPEACALETRLKLLEVDFVIRELINPLMRNGVSNPQRVIRRCPILFTAAIMRDGDQSRLTAALSTLNELLTRKDLAVVVKNFPVVLTRSREELESVHTYMTREMGLEGWGAVRAGAGGGARAAWAARHSTRLLLALSPAWRLPLVRTAARHALLRLAANWPPALPSSSQKSRDYILSQLLTCPPEQFSFWLEYHDVPISQHMDGRTFAAADVRQFEKIYESIQDGLEMGDGREEVRECEEDQDNDGDPYANPESDLRV